MNNSLKSVLFVMLVAFSLYPRLNFAWDELVVIRNISNTGRSFVIQKGREDGIRVSQRRSFSNDKLSMICEAVEAGPNMSLWSPVGENVTIGFEKGEMVVLSNPSEASWAEIARVSNMFETSQQQAVLKRLKRPDNQSWIVRGGFAKGITETTSDTASEMNPERHGYHVEGLYNRNFQHSAFEWGLGLRYDRESATIAQQELVIQSYRYIVMGELLFNFEYLKSTWNNFYAGIGMGVGRSYSVVDDTVSNGWATVLPEVKIGHQNHIEGNRFLMVEVGVESIASVELFPGGVEQKTNLIQMKAQLGLRF